MVYCLEGIIEENSIIKCTKCILNANLNKNNNICECNYNSFGKNGLNCYKCDDSIYGNIGCEPSKGCEFFPLINQLNCNKCKNGYFEYTKGQCYSCSNEVNYCNKCMINQNKEFICENCI